MRTATVVWCERALAVIPPTGCPAHAIRRWPSPIWSTASATPAGRRNRSRRRTPPAKLPGDADQLWLNPRSARGVLRLVDDDLDAARADLESVAVTASRLGILNTSAFSFAYLARTEWVAGAWDDALLHAERAVAINLESDFGFMQTAVLGIAVLVPAGRGDWAAADAYLVRDDRRGTRLRAIRCWRWRCRARGSARPAATRPTCWHALEPVRRFPNRDAADEPGFWPWQDLYADALVAARPARRGGRLSAPPREARRTPGPPHSDRQAGQGAWRARGGGRPERSGGRGLLAARCEATDGLRGAVRAGPDRAGGRPIPATRRAAPAGGRPAGHGRSNGSSPSARRPTPSGARKELAASGLAPAARIGRDRAGLTSQELVVARLAARRAAAIGRSPMSWWSASRRSSTTCATRSPSSASPPAGSSRIGWRALPGGTLLHRSRVPAPKSSHCPEAPTGAVARCRCRPEVCTR